MRIGELEVAAGQKRYGFLAGPQSRGGFDVHIPLHVIAGHRPGPRLVVQAGLSGLEIEPAMTLPKVVEEIDPAQLAGTLIVVPLMNTTGFEFEQVETVWDNQDLNCLGRGRADGTLSEQLLDRYYAEVVADADALIDIHTGALWGYFCYAGVYLTGKRDASSALALALGLPQVLLGQPSAYTANGEENSLALAAAQAGKAVVSAWIGGGPGLRDFRQENADRTRRAVFNAMHHLGMLAQDSPAAASPGEPVTLLQAHTVIRNGAPRGMVFMDKSKRGQTVAAGEPLGYVRHPFTGDTLHEIVAPRGGVMLHAGAVWPMIHDQAILAILGDPV
jgi:predicted deacylase